MKVKEESGKISLKLNFQKTKIMVSGPITSWKIDRETVERVADFIFLGSKIIADGDCSHKIKRHLLLGRKAMTNLDSMLKRRCITLLQFPSILDTNLLFKDTALKIAPISSVSIFLYFLSTIPLLYPLLNPFQPNFCCQPLPLNCSDQCSILSPHLSNWSIQGISSSC